MSVTVLRAKDKSLNQADKFPVLIAYIFIKYSENKQGNEELIQYEFK